jgi:hypothetical protein
VPPTTMSKLGMLTKAMMESPSAIDPPISPKAPIRPIKVPMSTRYPPVTLINPLQAADSYILYRARTSPNGKAAR